MIAPGKIYDFLLLKVRSRQRSVCRLVPMPLAYGRFYEGHKPLLNAFNYSYNGGDMLTRHQVRNIDIETAIRYTCPVTGAPIFRKPANNLKKDFL